jgi:hypothetical protein
MAKVVDEEEGECLDVVGCKRGERRNVLGGEERKEVVLASAVSAS